MDRGFLLRFYKREDIRKHMVEASVDREVSARFEKSFGKRPDILSYPNDVLEIAKRGATSFHVSEERWSNPLQLSTGLRRKDLDDLRIGWDLVLDIDCPIWEYSKLTTHLLIKALKAHGIRSISVKFSGNKGFHIGVPFEAFPSSINEIPTEKLFPEAARTVAEYLAYYIDSEETNFEFTNYILKSKSINEIVEVTGKTIEELSTRRCLKCDHKVEETKEKTITQFVCPACQHLKQADDQYMRCEKCNTLMERMIYEPKQQKCPNCGNTEFYLKFDPTPILDIDTVLISSRHLYRMPYSLHEKSGLFSLPFNPDGVMHFQKHLADPRYFKVQRYKFLDTSKTQPGECTILFEKAYAFVEKKKKMEEKARMKRFSETGSQTQSKGEFKIPEKPIPAEFFPPCMLKILEGMQDGKKRAMFMLVNFFNMTGWQAKEVYEQLKNWNDRNPEPLRANAIESHVRYHCSREKKAPPPNCSSTYYKDLGVCTPDNLCSMIKNPIMYAIRKAPKPKKRKSGEKTIKKDSTSPQQEGDPDGNRRNATESRKSSKGVRTESQE